MMTTPMMMMMMNICCSQLQIDAAKADAASVFRSATHRLWLEAVPMARHFQCSNLKAEARHIGQKIMPKNSPADSWYGLHAAAAALTPVCPCRHSAVCWTKVADSHCLRTALRHCGPSGSVKMHVHLCLPSGFERRGLDRPPPLSGSSGPLPN